MERAGRKGAETAANLSKGQWEVIGRNLGWSQRVCLGTLVPHSLNSIPEWLWERIEQSAGYAALSSWRPTKDVLVRQEGVKLKATWKQPKN